MTTEAAGERQWWRGITRYQWIVLIIACLGWIFDVFEGQIFVASMNEAMPSLLGDNAPEGLDSYYNNLAFGFFLFGGFLGGVLFGMLSDRIGRTRTMVFTILMYACFTGITAFVWSPWQMVILRFFVAMGVGGEWAVASAMVAEVMPTRARARLLGVFHASSVFGTILAVAAGALVVGNPNLSTEAYPDLNWRLSFLVGVVPALLVVWIRLQLREPEEWTKAREAALTDVTKRTGDLFGLFGRDLLRNTLVGVTLAAVGLATFWGVHIYGKDLMRGTAERPYAAKLPSYLTEENGEKPKQPVLARKPQEAAKLVPGGGSTEEKLSRLRDELAAAVPPDFEAPSDASDEDYVRAVFNANFGTIKDREMLGMLLTTIGGGLGLVMFGPVCERIGRRGAFLLYHVGGLAVALALFQGLPKAEWATYVWALPIFGFLTLGMHAGYAIYFPELFPTRLRGTGGGFCFNVGRIIAAPILFLGGWLQAGLEFESLGISVEPMSLERAASILSVLYLLGVIVLLFAPETRGQDLPE